MASASSAEGEVVPVEDITSSSQPVDPKQSDLEPWIALTNHLRSLGFSKSAAQLEEELQGFENEENSVHCH
jgi:hypothetical protein